MAPQGPQYAAIEVPPELGVDCQRFKWRQSQTHVEVFVPLPPSVGAAKVHVALTPTSLTVDVDEARVLHGALWAPVKAEESTWYVQDGVLELMMLKRCRRGHYEAGQSNAGGQAQQQGCARQPCTMQQQQRGALTAARSPAACRHLLARCGAGGATPRGTAARVPTHSLLLCAL